VAYGIQEVVGSIPIVSTKIKGLRGQTSKPFIFDFFHRSVKGVAIDMESVDYKKGETPMTDYQFKQYESLRDKLEEAQKEIQQLREENAKLKEKLNNH